MSLGRVPEDPHHTIRPRDSLSTGVLTQSNNQRSVQPRERGGGVTSPGTQQIVELRNVDDYEPRTSLVRRRPTLGVLSPPRVERHRPSKIISERPLFGNRIHRCRNDTGE